MTYNHSMASGMVHGVSLLESCSKRLTRRMMDMMSVMMPTPNQAMTAALDLGDMCRRSTVGMGVIMSSKSVTPPAMACSTVFFFLSSVGCFPPGI